jgi:hypothetical protein
LAIFESFGDFVDFMISKYGSQISSLNSYILNFITYNDPQKLAKAIVKFYIINFPTINESNVYDKLPEDEKLKYENIVIVAINEYNNIVGQ